MSSYYSSSCFCQFDSSSSSSSSPNSICSPNRDTLSSPNDEPPSTRTSETSPVFPKYDFSPRFDQRQQKNDSIFVNDVDEYLANTGLQIISLEKNKNEQKAIELLSQLKSIKKPCFVSLKVEREIRIESEEQEAWLELDDDCDVISNLSVKFKETREIPWARRKVFLDCFARFVQNNKEFLDYFLKEVWEFCEPIEDYFHVDLLVQSLAMNVAQEIRDVNVHKKTKKKTLYMDASQNNNSFVTFFEDATLNLHITPKPCLALTKNCFPRPYSSKPSPLTLTTEQLMPPILELPWPLDYSLEKRLKVDLEEEEQKQNTKKKRPRIAFVEDLEQVSKKRKTNHQDEKEQEGKRKEILVISYEKIYATHSLFPLGSYVELSELNQFIYTTPDYRRHLIIDPRSHHSSSDSHSSPGPLPSHFIDYT